MALLGALAKDIGKTPMDILTEIRNGQTLLADAKDAIDQVMAAKLGAAGLGAFGGRFGFPHGYGKHAPEASPSA